MKDRKDVCKCCGYKIYYEEIGLCEDVAALKFLGPNFPMYFIFIKYMTYLLASSFILFGIYGLSANLSGNYW